MSAAALASATWAVHAVLRRFPDANTCTIHSWGSPEDFTALQDGALDAMVLVGPIDVPGLCISPLAHREGYAVLAASHPLAGEPVLRLEDIIDLPTFRRPDAVLPRWRSYWLNAQERGNEPRYIGRSTTEADALMAIGSKRVVGVAPDGWGRLPGLATRLIRDLPPVPIILATRPEHPHPILRVLIEALSDHAADDLTLAERRVAAHVAEGYADHEIADRLCLSPRTVESHVANARRRLGLRSRAHLAAHVAGQALVHDIEPPSR